ncbi:MAG: hypothetical protein Q3988_00060 [Gemella sp.]|nr:hypothetical protein [Gemella sp.]
MAKQNEILNENAIQEIKEEVSLEEYDIQSLEEIEAFLEKELKFSAEELEELKIQREKIDNPESIGSVIKDEIFNQIAIQTGLDLTSDTAIGNQNLKEVGKEYIEKGDYKDKVEDTIRRDKKFAGKEGERIKLNNKKNKEGLEDAYTGNKLTASDKIQVDHVVSGKEITENRWRQLAGIDAKDLANKKENLVATNPLLNQSKQDKSMDDFIEHNNKKIREFEKDNEKIKNNLKLTEEEKKEKILKNNEKIRKRKELNEEKAREIDRKARKSINREIVKGVTKNVTKTAVKHTVVELGVIAIKNLVVGVINAVIRFFKNKNISMKVLISEIKFEMKKYFDIMKKELNNSKDKFLRNAISELLTGFGDEIQRLIKKVKQTISLVGEAVKYIMNKENWKKGSDILILELSKILLVGLTPLLASFSGDWIASKLEKIPVFRKKVKIPNLENVFKNKEERINQEKTLGEIIGGTIGAIFSGVAGALGLHFIQSLIINKIKEKQESKLVDKKSEIINIQTEITVVKESKLTETINTTYEKMAERRLVKKEMIESVKVIQENLKKDNEIDDELNRLKKLLEL